MTRQEHDAIREMRLQLVTARPGENLEQLSKRTGNVWEIEITATVNQLPPDESLTGGQLIKIGVWQPYSRK